MGELDLEENAVKTMGPYDPVEPLASLTNQLKKGREFAIEGSQTIANTMVVSKGITLLEKKYTLNGNIREWHKHSAKLKTWSRFKTLFRRAHR